MLSQTIYLKVSHYPVPNFNSFQKLLPSIVLCFKDDIQHMHYCFYTIGYYSILQTGELSHLLLALLASIMQPKDLRVYPCWIRVLVFTSYISLAPLVAYTEAVILDTKILNKY